MSDNDIKSDFEQCYNDSYHGWSGFLSEAEDNMKVFLGDQLTHQEKAWLKQQDRSSYVFNKVARFIYLISGFEIKDRHILKIGPISGEDDHACSQMTGLVMHAMNAGGGYDISSDAFLYGPLVSGANMIEIFPNRDGDLQFSRLAYNEFLMDPNLTKLDLSDCQHIERGKWLYEEQVKKLLPNVKIDFKALRPSQSSRWNYLPGMKRMYAKELRLYEEFWRRETKETKKLVLRDDQMRPRGIVDYNEYIKQAVSNGYRRQDVLRHIKDMGFDTFTEVKDAIRLSVLVDGEVVYDGDNPTGLDTYNYVLMPGIFVPEYEDSRFKLQGLMLRSKDPQRATNRRICQIMDIVEKRIQEAIVAREGSLVNWKSIYKSGQGLRLWVSKNVQGNLADQVYQLPAPDIQPGMFQFYDLLGQEAIEILGLNQEILGSNEKEIPGILNKYRTGSALTGLQYLYKNYRQAKIHLGRLLVKYIQANYNPLKVQRIINEQPAPGFYHPDMTKYDCQPVEGLLTDTQRQLAYSELRMLKADFPDLGITGDVLLNLLPLQLPNKIRQLISENQKKQEAMQKQVMQQQERANKMQEAITASEVAQAQERMTASAENRSSTAYDRAKTAETIAGMQDDRALKYLDRAIELEKIGIERAKINQGKNEKV
jgi:hypothetical protein